jgi:hypothetical protein
MVFQKLNIKLIFEQFKLQTNSKFYRKLYNYTVVKYLDNRWIWFYRLGLYEYNFLGRNTVLGGYYQYNEFHSYGINFSSPSLFSANVGAKPIFKNGIVKSLFYKQQQSKLSIYEYFS